MTQKPGPAFALALASISFIGPLAIHLFMPVIPAVKAALGISDAMAQLTFSIALFAMAFSTLVYGSLSDRYGRRPLLLSGLCLFLIGSAVSVLANSVATLVFGRLIQAIGAGCGITLVRAIAQDVYGRNLVKAIAYLTMAYTIGPMIAPIAGGILIDVFGWRSVFIFALAAGALITLNAYWAVFESRPPSPGSSRHAGQSVLRDYAVAVSPRELRGIRAAKRLLHRVVSGHRDGGIDPLEGDAASSVHRVRLLFSVVSVRILVRQFHHQPHRHPHRQRDHGVRRIAARAC